MANTENKKARFNYEIIETLEAGIVLAGNEVKSIRAGKINLIDAFITIRDNEAWIHNFEIQMFEKANSFRESTTRMRKLLLHKNEINRMIGKTKEKGLTLVPLKIYFKHQRVKLLIGLGKGKKTHDKRESIKERELQRELNRDFKYR